MDSQGSFSESGLLQRLKSFGMNKWETFSDRQKALVKKAWSILTYKWRWQIAMNIPYLLIFSLDRTVPAVHEFDMALLSSIISKVPIPAFISSWIGLG